MLYFNEQEFRLIFWLNPLGYSLRIHLVAPWIIYGESMIFLLPKLALAELPLPLYPECGEDNRFDLCPSDLEGEWYHYSFIPEENKDTIRQAELELGSGNNVDRAFRYNTGRFDVPVGIMDSGVYWDHEDLRNKMYLHQPELPLPQFADGTESETHDLNGDGLFNIQDYAEDPRVFINAGVDRGDGVLDPSDIIYTFSDGVDDDGNGYVDDISGWDFFERDNDAFHTYYDGFGDHGTGVAREVGAEGNNGGDIGSCPNCSLVPLRVGETFLTDGGRCAEAIAYGADLGVASITMAVGALSNGEATTEAARYAWDMGTLLVGAAGDENSYHHNFPAVLDDTIYTHSITWNSRDGTYSYMNTWNCNNFGARMTMVAASGACATGATATIAGGIGLLKSTGRDQGIELSAGEIYQLLSQHSTDIHLSDLERAESKAYPSEEGWDPFYGYGCLNLADSVKAVVDGKIPPVVSIRGVDWFEVIDPAQQSKLEIEAVISADRSSGYTWELEMGIGHDPRDWSIVDSGSGSEAFEGVIASLDVASIPQTVIEEPHKSEGIIGRLERVNQPAVTLRLKVNDADSNSGEMRKTFFVKADEDLKTGFPFKMSGSGEASPILIDMTGDGVFEIIVGDASGRVYVLDGAGNNIDGFPVQTEIREGLADSTAFSVIPKVHDAISATPAAGDLDGDGDNELVVAGLYGGIYAWHHDGTVVDGFPYYMIGREPEEITNEFNWDNGFVGAPSLYDLDDDGTLEIVAMGMDGRLYITTHDGGDWGVYPKEICAPELCGVKGKRSISSVAIGDVDNDGDIDLGVATNEAVQNESKSISYILEAATGEPLEGWPFGVRGLVGEAVLLPVIGEGHPASLAFADLDKDGDMEIANAVMLGTNPPVHHDTTDSIPVSFFGSDFSESNNAPDVPSLIQMVSNPVFGDLNKDGYPDYITSGVSSIYLASLAARTHMEYQQGVGAWSGKDGVIFEGWPRQIEDVQFLSAIGVADVSGDDYPEVIAVSAGYLVHAWDKDGVEAEGWPKFTGHWILGSPAVGDVDGDGYVDVAVTTREGSLFVWGTKGRADQTVEWASMHHDPQNTGNYHHPLATQAGPVAPEEQGCCKRKKDKEAKEQAWLLLPLLAIMGWRRRY